MSVFVALLERMIPLYAVIIVGYMCGKYLGINKVFIAKVLLYVLIPVVSFKGVLTVQITGSVLSLPILSYFLCTVVALVVLFTGGFFWQDGTKNMLSVGIANGNFGYLGLPLALLLLGPNYVALTALFGVGAAIFVATLGMFVAARAHSSLRESVLKVVRMPLIYALVLGLVLNVCRVSVDGWIMQGLSVVNVVYSVLGLILLGVAVGELGKIKVDAVLMVFTSIMTYVLWPVLTFGFIFLDENVLRFYTPDVYKVLLLMSILPVGVSIVSLSTELKVHPEEASLVVLFTTLISLVYIPVFISLFMPKV